MPLNIRSMRLVSTGSGRAMTEILVSDHADQDMAVESLRIRVTIPLAEINVRTAEHAAMKRTLRICEEIERCLSDGRVAGAPLNTPSETEDSGNGETAGNTHRNRRSS